MIAAVISGLLHERALQGYARHMEQEVRAEQRAQARARYLHQRMALSQQDMTITPGKIWLADAVEPEIAQVSCAGCGAPAFPAHHCSHCGRVN